MPQSVTLDTIARVDTHIVVKSSTQMKVICVNIKLELRVTNFQIGI